MLPLCVKNYETIPKVDLAQQHFETTCYKKDDNIMVEVDAMLKEHYCLLSESMTSLDSLVSQLDADLPTPDLPCTMQRRALQVCYTSHMLEPLCCQQLVRELMECARQHALHGQR